MAQMARMTLTLTLAVVLMLVLGARLLQAEGWSAEVRARVLKDQAEFVEAAATAIHWFGDARGLNPAAIEDYIAAERAQRRASVVAGLMAADLNADGAVSAQEVARLAPALAPQTRGRLIASHALADTGRDGSVDAAEMTLHSGAEALRLVSEKRAEVLHILMLFDLDGDGWVLLDEVRSAVADLAS